MKFNRILGDDHSEITVINTMGTDSTVADAARVSYGEGTRSTSSDTALINYLLRHDHTSPFEMCVIQMRIAAPLFVARQWLRHRTAAVNEYSARYSVMPDAFYIPHVDVLSAQIADNKQGRDASVANVADAEAAQAIIREASEEAYAKYTRLLPLVSREIARTVLPVNIYTTFYWTISLHNLMHFLRLRADAHSQWEIRAYANIIAEQILPRWVPATASAYLKYRAPNNGAVKLSRDVFNEVARHVSGCEQALADGLNAVGVGAREVRETLALIKDRQQQRDGGGDRHTIPQKEKKA